MPATKRKEGRHNRSQTAAWWWLVSVTKIGSEAGTISTSIETRDVGDTEGKAASTVGPLG